MGYQIQYDSTIVKNVFDEKKSKNKRVYWLLLATLLIVGLFVFDGKDWFIPGDPEVTKAAVQEFQEDLKEGKNIGQAFSAFCKEIVDGAELS